MFSWWNSLYVVSILVNVTIWSVALLGIAGIILGKRQSTLQERAKIAEKKQTDQQIAELQPKPLKERIRVFLNTVEPQILILAEIRNQRDFQIPIMTEAQVADLQRLCSEDKESQFIKWIPQGTTITNVGRDVRRGKVKFSITDELVH